MPPFMSVLPRPYSRPSRISAPNGSKRQSPATGTTSMCPSNNKATSASSGPISPSTEPLPSVVTELNPASRIVAAISAAISPSLPERLGMRTIAWVNATTSRVIIIPV